MVRILIKSLLAVYGLGAWFCAVYAMCSRTSPNLGFVCPIPARGVSFGDKLVLLMGIAGIGLPSPARRVCKLMNSFTCDQANVRFGMIPPSGIAVVSRERKIAKTSTEVEQTSIIALRHTAHRENIYNRYFSLRHFSSSGFEMCYGQARTRCLKHDYSRFEIMVGRDDNNRRSVKMRAVKLRTDC